MEVLHPARHPQRWALERSGKERMVPHPMDTLLSGRLRTPCTTQQVGKLRLSPGLLHTAGTRLQGGASCQGHADGLLSM